MQHNGWDHALKVTADGAGLVGHAGAVLLRKAADQAGLAAASTSRWSVNVLEPAFPGRSSIARHSRVLEQHAPNGWKP